MDGILRAARNILTNATTFNPQAERGGVHGGIARGKWRCKKPPLHGGVDRRWGKSPTWSFLISFFRSPSYFSFWLEFDAD